MPFTRHFLSMSIWSIINLFELFVELNEVAFDSLEDFKLVNGVQLLIELRPLNVIEPVGWIWLDINLTTWTSQKESPFYQVNLVVSEENLHTEHEGEQELVSLEQRSTDVLVERKCEIVIQILYSDDSVFIRIRVFDTSGEESLEPLQRVLIHWVNLVKVGDAEVQNT